MAGRVRITLVGSPIGQKPNMRKTIKALGLGKISSSVVIEKNPAVIGMARRIAHLVNVEEIG